MTWTAVGFNGTIVTSPDGFAWTAQDSGVGVHLRGVAHDGSRWVVVGDSGTILTSPTGQLWTPQTSGTSRPLRSVAHGNGLWVAVGAPTGIGDTGIILTSSNGMTWSERTNPSPVWEHSLGQNLLDVRWRNGLWVAVGDFFEEASNQFRASIITSPDGITWQDRSILITSDDDLWDVEWSGQRWVAVGTRQLDQNLSTKVVLSADGVDWQDQGDTEVQVWGRALASDGSRLVAGAGSGGQPVIVSDDHGETWAEESRGGTAAISGIAWHAGLWVAVGSSGLVATSPDGLDWTLGDPNTEETLWEVAAGVPRRLPLRRRQRGDSLHSSQPRRRQAGSQQASIRRRGHL